MEAYVSAAAFGSGLLPPRDIIAAPYNDPTGDGSIAANDALAVINAVNADEQGEGESGTCVTELPSAQDDEQSLNELLILLAFDLTEQAPQGRRRS